MVHRAPLTSTTIYFPNHMHHLILISVSVEIPEYKINNWNKFHLRANLSESLADEPIGLSSIATAYNLTQAFAQQHPGYDCLVARAKSIPRILQSLGNVFTAYPPVGSILCEAVRVAEKDCVTSKGIPATFHVGTRNGNWENDDAVEYMKQNAVLAKVGACMCRGY